MVNSRKVVHSTKRGIKSKTKYTEEEDDMVENMATSLWFKHTAATKKGNKSIKKLLRVNNVSDVSYKPVTHILT